MPQPSRQPKKVVGDIRVRTKILDPALHFETSRHVVDLRVDSRAKSARAEVQHKGKNGWVASAEVTEEEKSSKLEVRGNKKTTSHLPTPKKRFTLSLKLPKYRFQIGFALGALLVALIVPGLTKVNYALNLKDTLMATGFDAVRQLASAGSSLSTSGQSGAAGPQFEAAYNNFVAAQRQVAALGETTLSLLSTVPGVSSRLSTGNSLLSLGAHVSEMGKEFSESLLTFGDLKFEELFNNQKPLTERFLEANSHLTKAADLALSASDDLDKINPDVLPSDLATSVSKIKNLVPTFRQAATDGLGFFKFLTAFLGDDNPKSYVIAFQNNSEIRATGGFIGSYARLDFFRGQVLKFKVDDVYNIDGQLKVNVIPPRPLQKITGAWSFHDSNWFYDFPASAQKMAWFYEKTGGSSLDGVLTFTPQVLEKLLALTGPVALPEYNETFTTDNVIDLLQYKVEKDFDKTLNQPKSIVADLAAKIMEKFKDFDALQWASAAKTFMQALSEKDVMVWFRDPALQEFAQSQGWTGEVKQTPRDYVAVVNTNLNGYKTDRMISQTVDLDTQITDQGEVIDTLTITRTHLGGHESYDWYNRVNSDYLRVYVPQGSVLLSAKGNTKETYKPPLDYANLPFITDPDIAKEESTLSVDPKNGTNIFTEGDKTVFGNWLYVSPGKSVSVTYTYKLPFALDLKNADTYSLLAQRQAGMKPYAFRANLQLPSNFKTTWQTPEDLRERVDGWAFDTTLDKDEIYGVTLTK